MEPFAGVQDVAAIWRPLSDDETVMAAAWISEASQQVRDGVPDVGGLDVDERLALNSSESGYLSPATVRSVVARMVLRVLKNPEGARQRSQTVDDYQESITIDGALSSGEMFISPREMDRLLGSRGATGAAFSVDTAPEQAMWSRPWDYPWDQIPT